MRIIIEKGKQILKRLISMKFWKVEEMFKQKLGSLNFYFKI